MCWKPHYSIKAQHCDIDYRMNYTLTILVLFITPVENIRVGDEIRCYCNDVLVGKRVWVGPYTDIPSMGNDGIAYTQNYYS